MIHMFRRSALWLAAEPCSRLSLLDSFGILLNQIDSIGGQLPVAWGHQNIGIGVIVFLGLVSGLVFGIISQREWRAWPIIRCSGSRRRLAQLIFYPWQSGDGTVMIIVPGIVILILAID